MKKCTICGKELPDYAVFCDVCGGEAVAAEEAVPAVAVEAEAVSAPAKKKSKKMWILLIAVASVCLIVLVGWLTNWFGLVSPLAKIGKAAKKTAEAKSFTIKIESKHDYGDYSYDDETTIKCQVDQKKETLVYLSESDYSTSLYVDGKEYYYSNYDGEYARIYDTGMDDGDIFDEYHDVYDGKKIDWNELLEKVYLDDYVDGDEVDGFIKTVYKDYLNNRTWLKEALGYSKQGKTYTFEPDLDLLCESIIDACDDSDAFDREAKENIEDAMEDFMDEADAAKGKVVVSITLNKGYISNIHVEISSDDSDIEYDITITDINKTEINTDRVIDRVERIIEKNACYYCGEYGDYEGDGIRLCYDCYYNCYYCGEYGYYEGDGDYRVCYDCRYECEECGDRCGSTYYVNGAEWCEECYDYCYYCGDYANYTYDGHRLCYDCYWNY